MSFYGADCGRVWFICEETTWCIPIHLFTQRSGSGLPSPAMMSADPGLPDIEDPVVDIWAAETVNLMAWTYYLLGDQLDQISPLIKKRMDFEIKRRIIDPLIQNMGSYIYKAHIAGDYYTNFVDAHVKTHIHPFHLFRYGQRTENEILLGLTASQAKERDILNKGIGDNLGRQLHFLFNATKIMKQ